MDFAGRALRRRRLASAILLILSASSLSAFSASPARADFRVCNATQSLVGVAIGVRLLIARVDAWSGRSLLVVGLLHSSFNATENLLQPEFFWVRIVVTIALGIGVAAFGRQPHPPSEGQSAGTG